MRAIFVASVIALFMTVPVSASLPGLEPVDPTNMNVGPYAGALLAGQSNSHHYQNAPDGMICVSLAQPYTVYVESTGRLNVEVAGESKVIDGADSITFWRGVCTKFDITVTALDRPGVGYAMEVVGGPASNPIADIDTSFIDCSRIC